MLRAGHHHRGDQERLRPDRRGRARAALEIATEPHRRDHLPGRARGALGYRRRRLRAARRRRDAAGAAPRTPDGWTSSASAARSTATRRGRSCEPGSTAGLQARVHADQLGEGPGVRSPCELGAASADHCTHLTAADVDALAAVGHRRDAAAGGGVLHPLAVPGRPEAARRGGDGRAGHRLQPGVVVHLVHAVLRRARRTRDGDDAAGGDQGGHLRRGARAARDRRRLVACPAPAPTSSSSTLPPTFTWPIGPAFPLFTRCFSAVSSFSRTLRTLRWS